MDRALQALTALVIVGGLAAVLVVVRVDDLVRSWAEGHSPEMRELLAAEGLAGVRAGSVPPPSFEMPAVVLFLVLAGMAWVLGAFFKGAHEWARLAIAVTVVMTAIATVAALLTDLPPLFLVIAVVSLVVEAALLFFLFHRDTTAYLHPDQETLAQLGR